MMHIIKRKQNQLRKQDHRITAILNKKAKKQHSLFHRINYDVNPFVYVSKPIKEITHIEDIAIQIDGLFNNYYELRYVLQTPELPKAFKKQLVDVLVREWEYDYYERLDDELEDTLERASYNPIKRIYRIRTWLTLIYILFTFISFIFLSRLSMLQWIPKIGWFFKYINRMFTR